MVAKPFSLGQTLAIGAVGLVLTFCLLPATLWGQQSPPQIDPFARPAATPTSPPASSPAAAIALAPENKISAALDQSTQLDFVDTPLKDVVTFLSELHGIPIAVNKEALEAAMVPLDSPLTYSIKGLRFETVLDILLRPLGLTYDATDELIEITTPKDLLARPHIRLYDCRDLLALGPNGNIVAPGANPIPPPALAPVGFDDIDALAQSISRAVDPQSWNTANGDGSATIENFKGMLIVSQTSRAHRQIESLLNTIRETAGLPPRRSKAIK
jgi:hypothetical protein